MIAQCPGCPKRFKLEEAHFRGRDRFEFKCTGCGATVTALKEAAPAPEAPSQTQKLQKVNATSSGEIPDAHLLELPEGKRLSLAVLQGPDSGAIFSITKSVFTIGRADADAVLNDTEVSRRHAQVEVKGSLYTLRDLKSTNGTYLNEQRVTSVDLEPNSEFRVGGTTLLFIVTEDIT